MTQDTHAIDVRNRLATIEVSVPLLAELVHMPPHMRIVEISLRDAARSARIRVSHPSLPEVQDGAVLPVLMPVYTYESRPQDAPTLLAADWGPDLGVVRFRL